MSPFLAFKKLKGEKANPNHALEKPTRRYSKNVLTPVTLTGVIVPRGKDVSFNRNSQHKLVCTSGIEYFLETNEEWRSVVSYYCWEEVEIVGLLNTANSTLIPQRVFRKGPKGEKENVVSLALGKSREAIKKIPEYVNELILVPAAVLAVAGLEAFN